MLTPGSGIPHLSLFGQWTYSKRHGYIYTVRLEWELQKTTLWLLAAWGNKKHHTVLIVARSTSQINKYLMSISQTQKCSYMSNLTNTSGHHTTKEFENWLAFKSLWYLIAKLIKYQVTAHALCTAMAMCSRGLFVCTHNVVWFTMDHTCSRS